MIYEQRTYVDDNGTMVMGRAPTDGGEMSFFGMFTTRFNMPDGSQEAEQCLVQLPGQTPQEAINAMPEAAKVAQKINAQAHREKHRPKLAIATNGHAPRITQ